MKKIGIVIPTLNEEENLKQLLPELKKILPHAQVIIMDDLSKDDTVEVAKQFGAYVPKTYVEKGYGMSLIEGIWRAFAQFDCDLVIQMDADHPAEAVKELFKVNADLVLGCEKGSRFTRGFACWLARNFLGLKFKHPTCGLRLWTRKALQKLPWFLMKAKGFSIQIETLYYAKQQGLKIKEVLFEGRKHKKLPIRRIFEWLGTFFRLWITGGEW